jgi:hypothetical protein
MELALKFEMAANSKLIRIDQLIPDQEYSIQSNEVVLRLWWKCNILSPKYQRLVGIIEFICHFNMST